MSPFQFFLIALALVLTIGTAYGVLRDFLRLRDGALWILVWVGMAFFAWQPDLLTKVARTLGIDRGANLLLYCAVIAQLLGFIMIFANLRRQRAELTALVREMAIQNAHVHLHSGEVKIDEDQLKAEEISGRDDAE